ncbi:fibronectin type III domain-containing protein, partial [Pontimonas sp.]
QVSWGVPLSRGGMAPSYLVEYSVVGSDSWSPVTGCDDLASTKCRVSDLSQWGSPHVFRVQASNVSGASSWIYSAEYSPYTLGDSGALAEQVLAGPGNGKLNVSWATLDLDAYDRGSSITHVQVRAVNVPRGGAPKYCLERVASGDGACDVVRLRNADPHSLAIRVKNRAGWSGWANISAEVEKVTPVPVALR